VGAGALGSPVAQYLAAAGVGRIGIVDDDAVELSNLNRQPLHFTPDISLLKSENAQVKLSALNPDVFVESYPARLDGQNAAAIVMGADLVVDCSDSFATRYAVNDACCSAAGGIPLVEAGVLGFSGLVLSIVPGRTACYRCAFPVEPPPGSVPSCREAGVLGAMAGVIGSIQALEALKLLTGVGDPLTDRLLQVDGASMEFTLVSTERRPGCPACAHAPGSSHS
ncbi:MAG: molybdopterin-synthase adenylyltransferase, partial [Thermoleophilaceae bacterium]|nr:molybdopterin-synthase adenylyltransferase [Thermoleophilaceae bacterium]